ncbi:uncharacterized protein UTRI_06635 [Ustilago trichophora]|uniref:Uncharacterized protein n=1 Tax=Ustilago trichophora TaxID=86804 RepID=A0A5C3EN23_9BASI|nr:uncharacterized protein UTRI_06635 [Ustilago trichophora]
MDKHTLPPATIRRTLTRVKKRASQFLAEASQNCITHLLWLHNLIFSEDVGQHERASQSDTLLESKDTKLLSSLRQKIVALTPPPPSFDPTASQISPLRANAVRDKQQRQHKEIARIKGGANAAPASSTSSVATSASTRTAAPSQP